MIDVKTLREWMKHLPDDCEVKIAIVVDPGHTVRKPIVGGFTEDSTVYYLISAQLDIK